MSKLLISCSVAHFTAPRCGTSAATSTNRSKSCGKSATAVTTSFAEAAGIHRGLLVCQGRCWSQEPHNPAVGWEPATLPECGRRESKLIQQISYRPPGSTTSTSSAYPRALSRRASSMTLRRSCIVMACLASLPVSVGARSNPDSSHRTGCRLPSQPASTGCVSARSHHRWSLDEEQIHQYHLGGALHPHIRWWEAMAVPRRSVQFVEVGEGVTVVSLVCDDLAQIGDVADLLRSVGPTLVKWRLERTHFRAHKANPSHPAGRRAHRPDVLGRGDRRSTGLCARMCPNRARRRPPGRSVARRPRNRGAITAAQPGHRLDADTCSIRHRRNRRTDTKCSPHRR